MIKRICNKCGKPASSDLSWIIDKGPLYLCVRYCIDGHDVNDYDLCIACLSLEIAKYASDLQWRLNDNAVNR